MQGKPERAKFGAEAYKGVKGKLPTIFPREMGPNCMKYLQEVVNSGLTSNMVSRFEKAFAKELGVKHCIATPGCTPALAVLAAALQFEAGDEVIVSCVTDYGTVQGLLSQHYIPVFADTAPGSVNISAETVAACITDRTRAVLAVHVTGTICDMDLINDLAKKHGLLVFEDACQATFGQYKGRFAGTLSKAAGFSFDSEKTLGSDIGGCVVTNDDELAERMRFFGQSRGSVAEPHFGRRHTVLGYAHRMTQCTAAISLAQLEIVRRQVAHIDKMARLLTKRLADIPGIIPLEIPDYMSVYSCWMFGFSIDPAAFRCTGEGFAGQLLEAGFPLHQGYLTWKFYLIPAALTFLDEWARKKVYPYSMPPSSREYRYTADTCPNANAFLENFICCPNFCEKWQPDDVELAAQIVREVAEKNRV
jgi:dTDP-4-amino-4,6-dideoxygalactose transaminase